MPVRLIDKDWESELRDGLSVCGGTWRLACPFIKRSVIERLLRDITLDTLEVVTRFNLADFASGVSDIEALRAIIGAGGHVRGLRHLHSKVFVFGNRRAAVTSANFTNAALGPNVEFGCVSDDPDFVTACDRYVQLLWDRSAGAAVEQLDRWQTEVSEVLERGAKPSMVVGAGLWGERR